MLDGLGRADGHGEHDPLGTEPAGDFDGGSRGRPGGQAVVDDQGDPVGEVQWWPVGAEDLLAAGQFGGLLPDHRLDLRGGQARRDLLVEDLDASQAEGAEGHLRSPGNAELPHDEGVQGQP